MDLAALLVGEPLEVCILTGQSADWNNRVHHRFVGELGVKVGRVRVGSHARNELRFDLMCRTEEEKTIGSYLLARLKQQNELFL